jgi:5S rRNA maturation endonuclease (ribonuclease M5)
MLSLKLDIDDIPTSWIFEFYCNLDFKLTGQNVKIKSLFNTTERTPSFWIHTYNNKYRFWDFSSGLRGSALQFVILYFDIDEYEAIQKIRKDYFEHTNGQIIKQTSKFETFNPVEKFKIKSFKKRKWRKNDAKFWLQFNISSKILEHYNVYPLETFTIYKKDKELRFEKPMVYGYFKKNGDLYKIYEPYNKKNKFLTFDNYLQGLEQLKYEKNNLIICSSLKDLMSLKSLNLESEYVSPNSENTIIKKQFITIFKFKYKNVYTLFDNDVAGKNASEKYLKLFNIPYLTLNLSKDVSDSIRDLNPKIVKENIIKQL